METDQKLTKDGTITLKWEMRANSITNANDNMVRVVRNNVDENTEALVTPTNNEAFIGDGQWHSYYVTVDASDDNWVGAISIYVNSTSVDFRNVELYRTPDFTPITDKNPVIRFGDDEYGNGVRFKAQMEPCDDYDIVSEVGWIITTAERLSEKSLSAKDFTHSASVLYVEGKNIVKSESKSVIFDTVEGMDVFAAVLYNIPADSYKKELVARPYVKNGESVLYGEPYQGSYFDLALLTYNNVTTLTPDQKTALEDILWPSKDVNMTVADGIVAAATLHAEQNGKTVPSSTSVWYDGYVSYAKQNGIISEDSFDDYTREITNLEMTLLLYNAADKTGLSAINDIVFIPGVDIGVMYWDKLLTLYNAGIITGEDEYGTFAVDSAITVTQCDEMVSRINNPSSRIEFTPSPFTSGESYELLYNNGMSSIKEGIASGWVLDNRGGTAKDSHSGFGTLGDVSTKYATCYIREFNFIPEGKIALELSLTCSDNGGFVSFKDIEGNDVYTAKIIDGKWCVIKGDGTNIPMANAVGESSFKITVDLNRGKSETVIDGVNYGEADLLSDNVMSLSVGIDEAGTGAMTVFEAYAYVNYQVNDNFDLLSSYGWNLTNASVSNKQLDINGGSAKRSFDAVTGTSITEFYINAANGDDYTVNVGDALQMKVTNKKLTVGTKELYTMTKNMWYRFRVDVNSSANTAKIWLNGRVLDEVALTNKKDVAYFEVTSTGAVSVDNVKTYKEVIPSDYVSAPTTRADLTDYIAVVNVCSLWKNGYHYGWACITPYDEPTPVLGYYDEGTPETADWEIKYMVEHGIDVQAFCWYSETATGPIKDPNWSEQLHDGYMYAKYSDYMNYIIQWEVGASPLVNSSQFRTHIVPYWFENYFLDDRYLKINNKIVLGVYSYARLTNANAFGSNAGVKAEFDYVEQVARSYGFDGVIFLGSSEKASQQMEEMGFDGQYAYNWGSDGSSAEHNINKIAAQGTASTTVHGVPTVSVGFDEVPWLGLRRGLITKDGYKQALTYVKNTYLPQYKNKNDWASKMVWLSTWNEFGEGTYIMPGDQNGDGFGYIDTVREVFTSLPAAHEDTVPTAHQRERINHLYPQYARLLRREGWYFYNTTVADRKNTPQNKLYINGIDILANCHEYSFVPTVINNGKVCFPFNPESGVNYVLGVHYEWRKNAGTLKIMGNGHEVVFEVGSDVYLKDGVETALGYTVDEIDGVPRIDFVRLATDLGYEVEEKQNGDVHITTDRYDEIWKNYGKDTLGDWQFNNYDSEGWESTNFDISVANGVMKMVTNGTADSDPIARWNNNSFPSNFYTSRYTGVEMRIKYKYDSASPQGLVFYFITDKNNSYSENQKIIIYLTGTDSSKVSSDGWVTVKADFSNTSMVLGWKAGDRLTGLRLDPFNCSGTIEFDYIKFIEDPNYVYVPPVEGPKTIVNGNAEGSEMGFSSANSIVSIVADPKNASNRVYYCKVNSGVTFPCFETKFDFESGATYTIEYDIMLGESNLPSSGATSARYDTNLIYLDKNNATSEHENHVILGDWITAAGGWKHASQRFTVKTMDSESDHVFRIYLNPNNGAGFSFYVDNVVVTKVG